MTELLAELRPGDVLGPYRVESLAAAGGSSLVYRATHSKSQDLVALKVARSGDGPMLQRMKREAALLKQADHRNIVGFRQAGVHGGRPFIVTDWIEGRSLAELVAAGGPLGLERALHLGSELADALDHLHRVGIVHRDLSLANVLIDSDGKPWLIDLGVGRSEVSTTVTMDGAIAGTPRYVAPEVIRDDDVDGRADQYSLAVVLHELITGSSPFPETDNAATALYQQLDALPEPLTEVDPMVPDSVEWAVLRALEKDPVDRFERVGDFIAAAWETDHDSDMIGGRSTSVGPLALAGMVLAGFAVVALAFLALTDGGDDGVGGGGDVGAADEEASVTTSVATPSGVPSPEDAETTATTPGSTSATTAVTPTVPGSGVATSAVVTVTTATTPIEQPTQGQAAATPCNLLSVADFDGGVAAPDFFAPAENERVVNGTGVAGSPALEVGRAGLFGQYAEAVEIAAGERYGFTGWFYSEGVVGEIRIGVTYLDENYGDLGSVFLDVRPGPMHRAVVVTDPAPAAARHALPWVYKDASPGFFYADEMLFAPTTGCAETIFAAGDQP